MVAHRMSCKRLMLLRAGIETRPSTHHNYSTKAEIIRNGKGRSAPSAPVDNASWFEFCLPVSPVPLRNNSVKLVTLLKRGKKPADPDDLLKPLLFTDLQDDLLRI